MNLRLVKIFLPLEDKTRADEILRKASIKEFWHDRISDKKILIRALVAAEKSEKFLDDMEEEFSGTENFRTVILPVEASIPRMKDKEEESDDKVEKEINTGRISREELYSKISTNVKLNRIYIVLIILATVIAAVGLVQGNIPMIVGAMIVAPLLGPSMGLSLGVVLADFEITIKSLKTMIAGILISFIFSLLVGFLFDFNPGANEIAMRTEAGIGDFLVSFSSGVIGALSFTTGTLTTLAGVMVAVSLLPPLVVAGMLFGGGHFIGMSGALLLFLINLICINFAGLVTFLVQKVSPINNWRALQAKFFTGLFIFLWFCFLLLVLGLMTYI